MQQKAEGSVSMPTRLLVSRVLGGLSGMAVGLACGARANDEFLTIFFGVMGAFLGFNIGLVRSVAAGLTVLLLIYLF